MPLIQNDIFITPSAEDLATIYRNIISVSSGGKINPNIPESIPFYNSMAIGGVVSGCYADTANAVSQIYPQYTQVQNINTALLNRGASPIAAATQAQLNLVFNGITSQFSVFTVSEGSILTIGSNTYIVPSTQQVLSATTSILCLSQISGIGYSQAVGAILTFSVPIIDVSGNPVYTMKVSSSTDGSNQESPEHAINRLLQYYQSHPSGNRVIDFIAFAIQANELLTANIITDAVALDANNTNITNYNCSVFGVGGSPINDIILNDSLINSNPYLLFNRNINTLAILAIEESLFVQGTIGSYPYVNSISTQVLSASQPLIRVSVQLTPGYTLSTEIVIDTINNQYVPIKATITIQNLIKREIRRVICGQQFGATKTYNTAFQVDSSKILLLELQQALDATMGANGKYTSVLIDRKIDIYDGISYTESNIHLSIGIPSTTGNTLHWVYDLSGYNEVSVINL